MPAAGTSDLQSGLDDQTGLPWEAADPADPATPGAWRGTTRRCGPTSSDTASPRGRRDLGPELASLRNYFVAQAATTPPITLRPNGPAALTPDGKFGVAWRQVLPSAPPHRDPLAPRADENRPVQMQPLPPIPVTRNSGRIELLWGPPGEDVAVLHWATDASSPADREGYSAIDLRTGRWLRHETGAASATSRPGPPASRGS